jgi:hypothetical protein
MLMTYSGHRSIRSLAKYARPSTDALGKWQAKRDPNRRGYLPTSKNATSIIHP